MMYSNKDELSNLKNFHYYLMIDNYADIKKLIFAEAFFEITKLTFQNIDTNNTNY